MKTTYRWLKDHLDTPLEAQELAQRLTLLGLTVDQLQDPSKTLGSFKIVEILSIKKHPNADRLKVCLVQTGDEILQVVCGDSKVHEGMKGVLARPGDTIPATGDILKPGKIRDVESLGMMCSEEELGLSESSEGVIQLPADAPVGTPYIVYKGLDDFVFDIEITPNRGDALGAYGLARDLSAAAQGELKNLSIDKVPGTFPCPVAVTIAQDTEKNCPLFTGRVIRNLQNRETPDWLKNRLQAIGLRPISAVVDITNYLAYDLGRPMHAFDLDQIKGSLKVQLSAAGDRFSALDEKEYELSAGMTIIRDEQNIQALAGIMGGAESGCSEKTTSIFLESALFDRLAIANAGRALNLNSDSRYRFERGVDAALVLPALEKATQMIVDICGGEVSDVIEMGSFAGGKFPTPQKIVFREKSVERLTGIKIPLKRSLQILEDLGFPHEAPLSRDETQDRAFITVPTWRHDIEGEADLVEEILRVHGYDHITPISPESGVLGKPAPQKEAAQKKTRQNRVWGVRRALSHRGLDETLTWTFTTGKNAIRFGGGRDELRLVNPIREDLSHMRPSLLPNLIEACARNQNRGFQDNKLYELGPQFAGTAPEDQTLVSAGVRVGQAVSRHWHEKQRTVDSYDVKGDVFTVLRACGFNPDAAQISTDVPDWYHPGRSGALKMGPKVTLAYFGELHPKLLKDMDIEGPAVGFEIFMDAIPFPRNNRPGPLTRSIYQTVNRDFAFILDRKTPAAQVIHAIQKVDRSLIRHIDVFDVYEGQGVPEGQKSLGVTIRLEPQDRTLTEEDLQTLSKNIVESVKNTTGGTLRA